MAEDLGTGKRIGRMQFDWKSSLSGGLVFDLGPLVNDAHRLRLVSIDATSGSLGTRSGSMSFVVGSDTHYSDASAASEEWGRLGVNKWNPKEKPPFAGFECQVSSQWGFITCNFNTNGHFIDTVFALIKHFILHFKIAGGSYDMWPAEIRRVLERPERSYEYFHVHLGRAMQFDDMARELLK